jgi:hypothetical protein
MKCLVKLLISVCALSMGFMGCGKDSSNSNPMDNVQQAAKDPDLQGKIFRGDCSMKPLDAIATGIATSGDASVKSAREQFEFVGANLTHAILLFNTSDCSGDVSLTFRQMGTFDIDIRKATGEGAKSIDINYGKLSLTINNDRGLKIATSIKLCGADDWKLNDQREVTDHAGNMTCYRQKMPVKVVNIYRVEGKTLFFGANGASASENRPTQLDRNTKYMAD